MVEEREPDKHDYSMIVNATPVEVHDKEMTYEHVVNIAFDNNPPKGPNIVITVTYSRGVGGSQGSLTRGHKVEVADGMVFNVKATDKS